MQRSCVTYLVFLYRASAVQGVEAFVIGRGKVGAVASKVTVEELAIRVLVAFSITQSYFTEPSKR